MDGKLRIDGEANEVTDFLSRLLDRALERTPMLQRRRPAMFEPTARTPQFNLLQRQGAAASDMEEVESLSETADVQDARSSHPVPPRSPYIAARLFRSAASESDGKSMIRQSKPVAPIQPSENDGERTTGAPAPPAAPEKPFAKPTAPVKPRVNEIRHEVTVEKSSPLLRLPSPLGPRRETPSAGVAPVTPAARARVTFARSEDHDIKTSPPALTHRRANQPAMIEPEKPTRQPAFAPLRRPAWPARRSYSEMTPPAAPPAPTVQVTIGRIEVRAAQPVAPTARPTRPAAPKLNLEDYLRSRSGGGQ